MKSLIVYFSHDKENYVGGQIQNLDVGNTKIVALKIQEFIKADLFEIKPLHDYPYVYHECTELAKKELHENARPKIKNIVSHIEQYDHIYLGFPSWWSTMPMCVWTFLESYDLSGKHIYPFCTHEGSGMGQSIQDIKKLCPDSFIHQGFAILGSQVHNCDKNIQKWLKEK
ncbi:MAG: flavodoxin [Coprobacillus cateniformis]|uniref:flavodoxin n=1 Tax=Longibaculum muris TaxID=1796628 RepID=UPI003AB913E9|nr:flavodoxin [Coprobacillus cateniformis]